MTGINKVSILIFFFLPSALADTFCIVCGERLESGTECVYEEQHRINEKIIVELLATCENFTKKTSAFRARWEYLNKRSKDCLINSSEWFSLWREALELSKEVKEYDYHYCLNAAISAFKLKEYDDSFLYIEEAEERGKEDGLFIRGVNKHKAFLLAFLGYYLDGLMIYQELYLTNSYVGGKTLAQLWAAYRRYYKSNQYDEATASIIVTWLCSLKKLPR